MTQKNCEKKLLFKQKFCKKNMKKENIGQNQKKKLIHKKWAGKSL